MGRFVLENLNQEERAFIESIDGLHRQIEALKIVFPTGRIHTALESMQAINVILAAAALKSEKGGHF